MTENHSKDNLLPAGNRPEKRRRLFGLGVVLFLFWLLLKGRVDLRAGLTGLFSVGITLLFYRRFLDYFNLEPIAATGFVRTLRFSLRVIQDIFISAGNHMKRVIRGSAPPALFTLKLNLESPMQIALIANAITLTPGSMTVEVRGSELTVLAFVEDEAEIEAFRAQIHSRYESLLAGGGPDA